MERVMKFLIVNCLNLEEGMRFSENSAEQLGILYIASSLRARFDAPALDIEVSYAPVTGALLDKTRPGLVGLTSVSQNYHVAQRYAKICKDNGVPVVIGGVHISTLPHTLGEGMDVGVVNEGEETMVELMTLFMEKGGFPPEGLKGIKGIVYRDGETLVTTGPRPRLKDLDTLPMPDRDLFYHPRRGIFTSRGCPYDCTFCFSKPFWGKVPRFFSAEYVIREMLEMAARYDISQIAIYDDLFTTNKARFKKIVSYIIENGLEKKVSFNCNVRPNEVTDEIAALLKSMNTTHVFLGIESGNQRVLKYLKQQACTVEQNYRAIRILKRHGILTYGGFILGSPDETRDEIMDTYGFIRRSGIDGFSPLMLTPLPGTPVWELAKGRGLVSDFMDWSILREEFNEVSERHILMSETLSRDELFALYMKFKRLQRRKLLYLGLKHPFMGAREVVRIIKRQYQSLRLQPLRG